MDRQTRRNIKHDRFVDEVTSVAALVKENVRTLLIAVIAIAVIGGGALGWVMMKRRTEQKAQERLAEAITILESPLQSSPEAAASRATHKTVEERAGAAESIFQEVAREFGGTDAADVASLFIAQIESSRGQFAEAEPRLSQFIEKHPDHVLADSARVGLYQLQLARGSVESVITDLEGELAKPDKKLPTDVLLALLANAYEVRGDTAKSRATWQRIVNEFPDSVYGIDAQRKLLEG